MKKHVSSFLFGCLGLGVGFTLCYVYLVLPERIAKAGGQPQFVAWRMQPGSGLVGSPDLIHPTIPPKVVGK